MNLEVDNTDHIYILGTTRGSSGSFDGKTRKGDYDIFLMKFDLDGNKM